MPEFRDESLPRYRTAREISEIMRGSSARRDIEGVVAKLLTTAVELLALAAARGEGEGQAKPDKGGRDVDVKALNVQTLQANNDYLRRELQMCGEWLGALESGIATRASVIRCPSCMGIIDATEQRRHNAQCSMAAVIAAARVARGTVGGSDE